MTAGPNLIGARLGGYDVQALIGGARGGTIAPGMLRQALTGVDVIARGAGLTLPFSVTSG